MAGLLSIERRDEVAVVTLQRPEKRNALSIELRSELAEAFSALSGDDGVGCVVLTGAGTAFCSGMDTGQFGGDLEPTASAWSRRAPLAFEAVGNCRAADRRGGQRPGDRGRFRARRCSATCGSHRQRAVLRLPRAAARDPAELRGGARGASGDRRAGALPHRPPREGRRGPPAGDRPRGDRERRGRPRASRSPSGSPTCRARPSSRPSGARCSSAGTSGAFCSRTSSECSAARCSADAEPEQDGAAA